MEQKYNMKSPAVKRLMREAKELSQPMEEYFAQPVEDNLFEWHFTVRGPSETEFEGGVYHGRIVLPPEYPMKPPTIIILTPNGRFEVNKKICLSISGHHPESWQPSWSIRTALLAIIGFMPTQGLGAIGSLDYTSDERRNFAKKSRSWKCNVCGPIGSLLREEGDSQTSTVNDEARNLALQISFKGESEQTTSNIDESENQTNADLIRHTNYIESLQRDETEVHLVTSSNASSLSSFIIIFLAVAIAALVLRRLYPLP